MLLDFAGIQWLTVVVAAVAAFIIGALWYSVLFAKPWVAAMGKTEAELKELQKSAVPDYVLAVVARLCPLWYSHWSSKRRASMGSATLSWRRSYSGSVSSS